MKTRVDRAALIRRALIELVAERGLHGAGMSAIAERAGVGTGTAYVHYRSKDELIIDAYREVKRKLGRAAIEAVDPGAPAPERFRAMWFGIHRHLAADPVLARFLRQIDSSPLAAVAHAAVVDDPEDRLMEAAGAPDMAAHLVDLPSNVLYDLGLGPVVRIVASGSDLSGAALELVARASWRAVTAD